MEESKTITAEQATEVLVKAHQDRVKACNAEIAEVLKKYGCALQLVPQQIAIVPAR